MGTRNLSHPGGKSQCFPRGRCITETERSTNEVLEKLARRWAALTPKGYRHKPLAFVRHLADRIIAEADPEVRFLLILRMLTDRWIMPLHSSRVLGHIMTSDELPREQKILLCELCLETRFPFVPAMVKMGVAPANLSERALSRAWSDHLMERLDKGIGPPMQLGEFTMMMFPQEFLRAPLVWSVCLEMMTPVQAVDWCRKGLKKKRNEGVHSARAYVEAATDILLNWRDEFPPERREAILKAMRQTPDVRARIAVYRTGTILIARDYARPGLDDRSNAVRKQCQLYLDKGPIDKPLACLDECRRD